MLLDRRKIRRWAKWVALALAIIFVVSFLFLGVGYGGAGFNISQIFTSGGCTSKTATSQAKTTDAQLAAYEQTLKTNPKDKDALIGLANLYQQIYDAGQSNGNAALLEEAKYLQQLIDADPTQIDVDLRLAKLYMSTPVSDNSSAVVVLNKATSQAPTNADVFLQLGIAQSSLGNKSAAVMAWQKYLDLAPNGDMASVVKQQIAVLSETTTTAKATTTTTAASSAATSTTTTTVSTTTTTVK